LLVSWEADQTIYVYKQVDAVKGGIFTDCNGHEESPEPADIADLKEYSCLWQWRAAAS
jgi:hypothetical protein